MANLGLIRSTVWVNPGSLTGNALTPASAFASMTDAQIATALVATTTVQDVAWKAICQILMNGGDWGNLILAAQVSGLPSTFPGGKLWDVATQKAAIIMRDGCQWGTMLTATTATVWNTFVANLNLLTLSTVGAVSAASGAAIQALSVTSAFPGTQATDVTSARFAVPGGSGLSS